MTASEYTEHCFMTEDVGRILARAAAAALDADSMDLVHCAAQALCAFEEEHRNDEARCIVVRAGLLRLLPNATY